MEFALRVGPGTILIIAFSSMRPPIFGGERFAFLWHSGSESSRISTLLAELTRNHEIDFKEQNHHS